MSIERYINHIQLGYFALVPFLACIGWSLLTGDTNAVVGFFNAFSMAITCFCVGSLWRPGTTQSHGQALVCTLPLFIVISSVFFAPIIALAILAAGIWFALALEAKSEQWQTHHPDYKKMRFVLSSVSFVCHLLMIAMLLSRP